MAPQHGGLLTMRRLQFALLLLLFGSDSESLQITVQSNDVSTLKFSTSLPRDQCSVCKVTDKPFAEADCTSVLEIGLRETATLNFTCETPQQAFSVSIQTPLDCSKGCTADTITPDWSYFPDFNRTFVWDMKVASNKAFQIDFPAPGMSQIQNTDHCPDKHTYTILMYPRSGPVNLGTFCLNGTIRRVMIPWKGRMSLEVPRNTYLNSSSFMYSDANVLLPALVGAELPRGQSNTDFYSASNIPASYKMSWNFVVPPKHNFTVLFMNYIRPECQKAEVKVTYEQTGKDPIVKKPTDNQPNNYQGNFNLTLDNCDAVTKNNVPELEFRVSVFRGGVPDICDVDLQNDQGLSLKIERKNPESLCELSVDSVVQDVIIVKSGSKARLSFLDCSADELILTATKTIECQILLCPKPGTPLTLPSLGSCLPTSNYKVNWDLRVPDQGSVVLSSPIGNLHQSVPGQETDCPMSLSVSEADGTSWLIGRFCSLSNKGEIQAIQTSYNVTFTAMLDGSKRMNQDAFFNVSFASEITDKFIYTITPVVSTPTYLVTPSWPQGMKSESTVSWIVNVPEDYNAELLFLNVTQPQCSDSHTNIAIQRIGSEEGLVFREDNNLVLTHSIPKSFYLNMSNCNPQQDYFAISSQITLQKTSRKLLSIILGVVGAILFLMIVILIIVCVALRKKKQQSSSRSPGLFSKGNAFPPGDVPFPKTRADNDSRVYATIDDAMVYSHLLHQDGYGEKEPRHFNGHQVDAYHTFTGPMDTVSKEACDEPDGGRGPFLAPRDTFIPSRPRTPLGTVDSMAYEDRRMVDNVLYTFKNTGDINTIRLSGAEPVTWPNPPEAEYDQAM